MNKKLQNINPNKTNLKIKPRSIQNTMKRIFFQVDDHNSNPNQKYAVNFEKGIQHRGRFGAFLYELKHLILNILSEHKKLRDLEHKVFINDIANNFAILTKDNGYPVILYNDTDNNIQIKLNKEDNNDCYSITIHRNNFFATQVKLFKKITKSELETFIKEAKNYITPKNQQSHLTENIDLFGKIDNAKTAVIINHISSKLNVELDKKTKMYIILFLENIIKDQENCDTKIFNFCVKNKIIKTYNISLLKILDSYKLEFKDNTSNLSTDFLFIKDVNQIKFNGTCLSNELLVEEINKFKLNFIYSELNRFDPIGKLKIINQSTNELSPDKKRFQFETEYIQFSPDNRENIEITFIDFTHQDNSFQVLKREEFLSAIKSYVLIFTGTYASTKYISNQYNQLIDDYRIVNQEQTQFDNHLSNLIINSYVGYVYNKRTQNLYYLPRFKSRVLDSESIEKEINSICSNIENIENIAKWNISASLKIFNLKELLKLIEHLFSNKIDSIENKDKIKIMFRKKIVDNIRFINCKNLFKGQTINSENDLQKFLDQYLGFNLFVDGPNLTGSVIPDQLKQVNKRFKNIPENYNNPIVLNGYSQGTLLPLEIAKSNPHLKFITILNVPTKGIASYGIFGKQKISYIPNNVTNAFIIYHSGIYPFFGHSIFKTFPGLDLRVDYISGISHATLNRNYAINDNLAELNYANILLMLQTELKRNYNKVNFDENNSLGLNSYYPIGTNDYYILSTMKQYEK